jgi:hypothetical protein
MGRLLLKQLHDPISEGGHHAESRGVNWPPSLMCVHELDGIAVKRGLARSEFVDRCSERVEVGTTVYD